MGSGVAQVAAMAGLRVVAVDVTDSALAGGLRRLTENLGRAVKKGKMTPAERDAALASVKMTICYEAPGQADIVVEAATENGDVKSQIVRRIDKAAQPHTIITSTMSSISITKLGATVSDSGRFIGMHFFNPVPAMGLVQVVRGLQTSDATHDWCSGPAPRCSARRSRARYRFSFNNRKTVSRIARNGRRRFDGDCLVPSR
jgi:3-hydroxybutyryl-CoA dehydrogenase